METFCSLHKKTKNSPVGCFTDLTPDGIQNATHALDPVPAGGSPALVLTAVNTTVVGARVLLLCRAIGVTPAAG